MFAVKWCELSRIVRRKSAGRCILWIVEPEAQVKSIGRCEGDIGIKAEDLVKQDRLDPYVAIVRMLPDLNVGLIPRESKAATESGIRNILSQERAPLNRKEIESEPRLEAI